MQQEKNRGLVKGRNYPKSVFAEANLLTDREIKE
jgi:hypothetical protein